LTFASPPLNQFLFFFDKSKKSTKKWTFRIEKDLNPAPVVLLPFRTRKSAAERDSDFWLWKSLI
jgi:hypothetical protein